MEVNYTFLCDYADNSGGKLTAVGIGFDTIYARTVPATHPMLYAVIGLWFSSVEAGSKQIGLRIVDADGNEIAPALNREVNVPPPPPGFTYRTLRLVMGVGNLTFEAYGDYVVAWLLGGTEIGRSLIKIAEPPPSPTTA